MRRKTIKAFDPTWSNAFIVLSNKYLFIINNVDAFGGISDSSAIKVINDVVFQIVDICVVSNVCEEIICKRLQFLSHADIESAAKTGMIFAAVFHVVHIRFC